MNAKQKQERNDRILANAGKLEEIRDIAKKVLGEEAGDPSLVHIIFENMRINGEMSTELLEGDLKNARGLTEQLYGKEKADDPDTVVSVYADCTSKDFEDEED